MSHLHSVAAAGAGGNDEVDSTVNEEELIVARNSSIGDNEESSHEPKISRQRTCSKITTSMPRRSTRMSCLLWGLLSVNSEIAVIIMVKMRFDTSIYIVNLRNSSLYGEFLGICPFVDNLLRTKMKMSWKNALSLCCHIFNTFRPDNKSRTNSGSHALMNSLRLRFSYV